MADDLVVWLTEQLTEDERVRREQGETHTVHCIGRVGHEWDHQCRCGFGDRVLAECNVKRRVMERPGPFCSCSEVGQPMDPDTNWTVPIPHHYDCSAYEAAKIFAEVYSDRPGYREEWRP